MDEINPRHVFPYDVLNHAHQAIDGTQIRLAKILEGRLAAMHYQWTWDDFFCAPRGTCEQSFG